MPVPKDAVAIESKTKNFVFYVDDSRYIKYYEGPQGGEEGPESVYAVKSLKLNTKPIKVSQKVTQIAAVAYKAGDKHEIRIYFARDDDSDGTLLKELCITDCDFKNAREGALDKHQSAAQKLADGSSISAVNLLSSSLLKVFVTLYADPAHLYVWYFGKDTGTWQHKVVATEE